MENLAIAWSNLNQLAKLLFCFVVLSYEIGVNF